MYPYSAEIVIVHMTFRSAFLKFLCKSIHYDTNAVTNVDMSDPPGHFMLFCKLQKGGLTDAKRSKRGIKNPIQIGSSGIFAGNRKC